MSNTTVAATILEQIGGMRRLSVMTGAKNFVAGEDRVIFSIGKGAKNKINKVRITLNAMDLYDVEFLRIWGTDIKTVEKVEGVYNDQLMDIFENATGFFLTINPRG
jgi:hypothetical protein